ncbi:hypothetical protein B0H16DRAFT_1703142 [Mycena metata]|uniref:Uncharacterized protein n=1 Tax=Mycena metata TaxID=1033252 RepID=A0AAD7H4Z1_9AGAR|nr:hypothetical protein B0H16DRAFT_1703142 [Mycena metata]
MTGLESSPMEVYRPVMRWGCRRRRRRRWEPVVRRTRGGEMGERKKESAASDEPTRVDHGSITQFDTCERSLNDLQSFLLQTINLSKKSPATILSPESSSPARLFSSTDPRLMGYEAQLILGLSATGATNNYYALQTGYWGYGFFIALACSYWVKSCLLMHVN